MTPLNFSGKVTLTLGLDFSIRTACLDKTFGTAHAEKREPFWA